MRAITPFHVMEVMRAAEERAASGGEVLHLEVGQPATPAPRGVLDAAHRALETDVLGYTTALGLPQLRERIAAHYRDWYDQSVDPGRIVVTDGASGACVLAFLAAFDEGARVAVPSPGYPCYRNILQAFGVDVAELPVDATSRFQPTPAHLDAAGPLDGLVVASPSNPTGTMLDAAALAGLSRWCDDRGAWLISDEIYHGITYGFAASTALATSRRAVVVNSFSKYFSMTGWRLGWMVLPDDLVTPVERLTQNLFIAAPTLAQHAAIAAFDCHEELGGNVARYAANRAVLLDGLPRAGLDRVAPSDGAFYLYAAVDHLGLDAEVLCRRWLDELGVAVTPGIDFDPARGQAAVRFSFAGAEATMVESMRRLASWRP